MSAEVRIHLAGAPRGKERVRTTKTGHVYTPERTVTYEGRLAYAAQEAMKGRPPLEGALEVDVIINVPIALSWPKKRQDAARKGVERPIKKPDWDNHAKICDALNLIVWVDDAQIVDGRVRKFYSDTPGMTIVVRPLNVGGIFG